MCIKSAETHLSFGQFTHEEYASMDATSLRKLLQRGSTRMKKKQRETALAQPRNQLVTKVLTMH
jgi:hypothetical protein